MKNVFHLDDDLGSGEGARSSLVSAIAQGHEEGLMP
jgi:hypothetical protein